jgi:hypothetical protein
MRRLLALALALFCLANIARAFLAMQQAVQMPELPTAIPPVYLSAMSIVWAAAFGLCAVGIWQSHRWASRVTIVAIVLYQANLWLNYAVFTRSPDALERIGFSALLSAISIILIGGAALFLEWRMRHRLRASHPAPDT